MPEQKLICRECGKEYDGKEKIIFYILEKGGKKNVYCWACIREPLKDGWKIIAINEYEGTGNFKKFKKKEKCCLCDSKTDDWVIVEKLGVSGIVCRDHLRHLIKDGWKIKN